MQSKTTGLMKAERQRTPELEMTDVVGVFRDPALKRAFHASWFYGGNIYLHGGVSRYSGGEPLDDVIKIDVECQKATLVRCRNSGPKRSHHRCAIIDTKWVCFIGGWDGKQRTTDVWALDLDNFEWTMFSPSSSSEPPAGLSSHTCTKVASNEVIISGREGGVRMQRRYGSVFNLKIDTTRHTYSYKELSLHISSRSGHIACLLEKEEKQSSKLALVIHGGRNSDSVELLGTYNNTNTKLLLHQKNLETVLKSHLGSPGKSSKLSFTMTKCKTLRHHAAVEAGKFCVVHGGEVFGKARDTVSGDLFIADMIANKWWVLSNGLNKDNQNSLKRMGHSIFYVNNKIYIVAGIGASGKVADDSVIWILL